jgi:hypothetical protein
VGALSSAAEGNAKERESLGDAGRVSTRCEKAQGRSPAAAVELEGGCLRPLLHRSRAGQPWSSMSSASQIPAPPPPARKGEGDEELQGCRASKEGEGGGARRRASIEGRGPADDVRPRRGGERVCRRKKKEKMERVTCGSRCHIGAQPRKPLRG